MMGQEFEKTLVLTGVFITVIGILFSALSKVTGLPKLPGDIFIKRGSFTFYFPWISSIVISIILSIIFYLISRR